MGIRGEKRLSQVQSGSSIFGQTKGGLSFDPPHILMYFVVLAIVIVLIALTIPNIGRFGRGNDVTDVEAFRDTLESDLNPSLISGSVVKSYELPQGYDELCFTDTRQVDAVNVVDNPRIQGSVIRSQRNVFLFGERGEISLYIDNLAVPGFPYYNCADAKAGVVEVELTKEGYDVVARLPVNEEYCNNAEATTLSDGRNFCSYLDGVYYQGYKGECCSSYGNCC